MRCLAAVGSRAGFLFRRKCGCRLFRFRRRNSCVVKGDRQGRLLACNNIFCIFPNNSMTIAKTKNVANHNISLVHLWQFCHNKCLAGLRFRLNPVFSYYLIERNGFVVFSFFKFKLLLKIIFWRAHWAIALQIPQCMRVPTQSSYVMFPPTL
jgi:hypothetical protein